MSKKAELQSALDRAEARLIQLKRERKRARNHAEHNAICEAIDELASQCTGYRRTLRVMNGLRDRRPARGAR